MNPPSSSAVSRTRGLLLGSFLGDALGGPVEFQSEADLNRLLTPPYHWGPDDRLDDTCLPSTDERLILRGYDPLRPEPEPYGHWGRHALPGTVTDDSRHKMVLIEALRKARGSGRWPLGAVELARAYLEWPESFLEGRNRAIGRLCREWLHEWNLASRWILGDRDPGSARPPERLWGGLSTCCGQMTLLPVAALHPGRPEEAYRQAYELAFFDNGPGRDLNAALVAGLAWLLTVPDGESGQDGTWLDLFGIMRSIDPFGYGDVPWVPRSVDRWLGFVEEIVTTAQGRPEKVFREFDRAFAGAIKWEAQVCFCVAMASLLMTGREPLAALPLSLEWGHDTDSYAQLVGAFIGARYGAEAFPEDRREMVAERVLVDYGFDLIAEADWLASVAAQA